MGLHAVNRPASWLFVPLSNGYEHYLDFACSHSDQSGLYVQDENILTRRTH